MPCRKVERPERPERPKNQTFRASTSERLSTPKTPHPANVPNRPSIYWLDYLETNEALGLKTPVDLNNYYNRFYANLPRLENLSRPRTCLCDSSDPYLRTASGIPVSALSYCASPRIKELAKPRTYDESGSFRLPPLRQSTSSSEEGNRKKWSNARQIKTAGGPGPNRDKYYESNYSSYKTGYNNRGRSTELQGGDAPSSRQMQYTRVPTSQKPLQQPSHSHSNISGNKKQGVALTGSDSGLKNKGRGKNRTMKLPPLNTSNEEAGQKQKPSRRQRSITKLPEIDIDNFR